MAAMSIERKRWRDFAHTVRVVTARSLAEPELNKVLAPASRSTPTMVVTRFKVTLLAAAGGAGIVLPKDEVLAEGSRLSAQFDPVAGEIRVTIQLKGYAALKAYAGKDARLITPNGAVEFHFRFNKRGTAVFTLVDTPEIRDGLRSFTIEILKADT